MKIQIDSDSNFNYTNSFLLFTAPLTIIIVCLFPGSVMPAQKLLIIFWTSLDYAVAFVVHSLDVLCYAKHCLTESEMDELHYMQDGREKWHICFLWKLQQSGKQTSAALARKSPH